jgi:hypothetical protein
LFLLLLHLSVNLFYFILFYFISVPSSYIFSLFYDYFQTVHIQCYKAFLSRLVSSIDVCLFVIILRFYSLIYFILLGKVASVVGTVLNEKLYIVGGYDWHLAEYSDTVYILHKKEKNINNNSNNNNNNGNNNSSSYNNNINNNNNSNTSQRNNANININNIIKNISNKGKPSSKTEFKWILQESRLLEGRSSHACVTFLGKIWIAGTCMRNGQMCFSYLAFFSPINYYVLFCLFFLCFASF